MLDIHDHLSAWQREGVVDAATALRIQEFESRRGPGNEGREALTAGEVVAYMGSVVLLVGLGFLYGTQYAALGSVGRLVLIGLVVAAGLLSGAIVGWIGGQAAARRARSAGWAVAALAFAAWFAQAFVDARLLTRAPQYPYPGAPPDPAGSIGLAATIGLVLAMVLLWRAGGGLLALVTVVLAFTSAVASGVYLLSAPAPWATEATWLLAAVLVGAVSEILTRGPQRLWAREALRFAVVAPPVAAALALSSTEGSLEFFAGLVALSAFGAALLRASAGYAIAGGLSLFVVVNEVGFRHFAGSIGFPVVLVASGITLLVVAAAMFRLVPQLGRRGASPDPAAGV